MRPIKMLGLTALAAIATMAFLGASSANAGTTAVCYNEGTLDAACTPATSVHFVTVGHAVLLGQVTVECNGLLSAITDNTLGGSVVYNKEVNLTYSNCLNGCGASTITQGTVTVLKTGVELADVTASGFVVKVVCFGLNCDYNVTNLTGHGIRSEGESHVAYVQDIIHLKEKLGGFITCPATFALDALFRSLTDLFIRA